ncbi:TIGR04282 family arsenosugar biosynthesis glycosyltransferase [Altibacter sp. HG106]|uniref:TIGR04282 family arsenosugar biosynthesis glycosyltransferase n=1 Tax=Altibacter sp. HG106 TaxID=3023937 RepID=UPI0023509A4F|nr:DUF2064 domain-containing protein [Altibacter sp. HG106]MDC7994244.1 DUF2064 domain-containing protein [Altibacter sp. HG106]
MGTTFGERYLNAIETVFAQGYDRIITIGNDTPQLTAAHLKQADKQLEKDSVVFGPSADGGYYLLGLHRSQYCRSQLASMPWQTSSLLRSIAAQCKLQGAAVHFLNRLRDLDRLQDARYFLDAFQSLSNVLKQVLNSLFGKTQLTWGYHSNLISQLFYKKPLNKGSPIAIY